MYDLSTFRPVCIYGSQYHIHAVIYSNLSLKKMIRLAINCTNSDRSDGFPHKGAHDQSQVVDEISDQ